MLMFGFGGLGFAAFSVGMKVGQIAEAAWWKGKIQEALTSIREPLPLRQMSLVRELSWPNDGLPRHTVFVVALGRRQPLLSPN